MSTLPPVARPTIAVRPAIRVVPPRPDLGPLSEGERIVVDHLRGNCHDSRACAMCRTDKALGDAMRGRDAARRAFESVVSG